MSSVPSTLDLRLAAELDVARSMLEEMGDELSASLVVVNDHGFALQAVDIVGQVLGHIANVVRAADRSSAIERIDKIDRSACRSQAEVEYSLGALGDRFEHWFNSILKFS